MARYASTDDLFALGAPEAAFEGLSAPDLESGLSAACDFVDSYLSGRFTLPLVVWGGDMRRAVCIIAAYDVITGRGYNTQNVGGDSDQLKERYDSIIQWLRDIARGDVTPVVTDSSTGGGGGGGGGGSGDSAAYVVAPRLVGGEYVVGPPVPRGW